MSTQHRRRFLQQVAGGMAALVISPEALPSPLRPRSAPLRVGVIGIGKQGRSLITELVKFEAVQVVALADVRETRLRAGRRRAPDAESFASHADLLDAGNVDAVFVATPTHLHRAVVLDCLQAGKHVYCEAPMASSQEDLQAIHAAADRSSVRFQVGHLARSNPVYQLARSFLRSGAIRDLVHLRAQSHQKTSWRVATSDPADEKAANWKLDPEVTTGLPGEIGSHQFDAVHWFTSRGPQSIAGSGAILAHPDGRTVPDTVSLTLQFPKGVAMQYEATLGNSFEGDYELYSGTMGTLKLAQRFGWMFKEADAPTQGWEVYASRERFHNEEGITLVADATKLAAQGKLKEGIGLPQPPLYYAVECFLKSVLEDQPVVCTSRHGLQAAMVGLLGHQAVVRGESQVIDPAFFED